MSSVSRRAFLKTAAVAGSLAATGRARAQASANERIRIGILGCRTRGHQLAQAFHQCGRFEVAAMADCDTAMYDNAMKILEKTLPAKPRLEQDFRRVLDDKSIDAIAVAAPDNWHAAMTVMGHAAGKHVYWEKPFSYNSAEGKAMVAAGKKHSKLALQVGTQHRSCQHIRDAAAFIKSGGVGKVGMARCWLVDQRPTIPKVANSKPPASMDFDLWVGPAAMRPYNEPKVHYNWHFIRDLGTGDMGNWGAHWLDSARQMLELDVPSTVSGLSNKVTDDEKEWPDTVSVLYRFPSLHIVWELRQWSQYGIGGKSGGVEINGDKGTVFMDRSGWWFYEKGKKAPQAHKGTSMVPEHVTNFADCVAGRAKPNAPAIEGFKSAVLCHLGNIASVLNRQIKFDAATMSIKDDAEAEAMQSREYRAPWTLDV